MSAYSMKCVSKRIHSRALHLRVCGCVRACVCVYVCVRRVQIQIGKGNVRAKGSPGKHYSPWRDGGDGRVRWSEREEKKERDSRRDVTLPLTIQDGGKPRSDSHGSSDSSEPCSCFSHQSCPLLDNSGIFPGM